GQNCPRGTALTTGMDYGGSLGSGNYGDKGPSITIGKSATTTTLAAVTGARVGLPSNLTANVTGGAAGDTIEFRDGATSIGTATLDGAGTATLPWTPTTAGAHTLTVNYPDTAFATASQSAPITAQVAEASVPSTIALAPITDGQVGKASTITATVTPAAAGGTVELKDGATSLATLPVGADGKATYQWTPSTAGAHTLNAVFSGRDGVLGSNTTTQVNVAEASVPSTIALAPITDGQVGKASTITATVTPAAAGGTVELKDGATSLATLPVGADGKATYQWTPSTAGAHTLNAVFSGRDGVVGSNTTAQVNVAEAPVPSTIALAPITDGQVGKASTITATVTPAAAGGTVELKDGATSLATLPVGADGKVTHQWTPAAAGAHTLTATFSGRDGVLGSTTTAQVNVTEAPVPSTVAFAPVTAAQVGRASTITATITPAAAGGTVELRDGATSLATLPVGNDGKVTYQWTPAAAGGHTLTATYSGHDNVTGSTTTAQVNVAEAPANNTDSTTTLNPVSGATVGKATTVTAKVTPANAGGTVTFKDGGTVIGTGQVGADGTATVAWTPATAGQRTITAEYSGHGTVNASSGQLPVTVAASGGNGGTGGTGSLSGFGS
ncbi:beta strand repeat-containing protein, partial [Rhodococcus oryzae]|uniref:beta strand repeat-containing protein n=1 Tax=Rhodococcus oryzae TaxID=2571143 RepID=UPI00371102D4